MSHRAGSSPNRRTVFSDATLTALFGRHRTLIPTLESAFAALGLGESKAPTLLNLPAELRLEIFDYILRPGDVYIRWNARAANHDIRFGHILEDWDSDAPPNTYLPLRRGPATQPPPLTDSLRNAIVPGLQATLRRSYALLPHKKHLPHHGPRLRPAVPELGALPAA